MSHLTSRRQTPTLTGYLAKRLALYLLFTLLALAMLAYLLDMVDLFSKAGHLNIRATTLMAKSLLKLPDLMQQMLPFAVLLATLITLNQLNRTSELIALKASGLPARRIMVGPLMIVLLVGTLTLGILNPLAAVFLKSYNRWHDTAFPGSAKGFVTAGGAIWLHQSSDMLTQRNIIIYGSKIDGSGEHLDNSTFFILSPNGELTQRVDATEAVLADGQWHLVSPTVMALKGGVGIRHYAALTLDTPLTPTLIQNSFTPPATLSVWELHGFIAKLRQTGFHTTAHDMAFQRLMALPAFLIAMFLLAVPFALTFTRTKGLVASIGAGLGLGFGFYLFGNTMAAFGIAGRLDATLAAWAPTLIAAFTAAALLVYLREE